MYEQLFGATLTGTDNIDTTIVVKVDKYRIFNRRCFADRNCRPVLADVVKSRVQIRLCNSPLLPACSYIHQTIAIDIRQPDPVCASR